MGERHEKENIYVRAGGSCAVMERWICRRPILWHGSGSQGHARQRRCSTQGAAFNDKSNTKFHDRDLYVFCYDMTDGKFTAHPNPATMGTDVRALKAKDDPLGQRIFDTINQSSGGSVLTVDYSFPKPGTTEPAPKQSFVTKVGNTGCGVGYYK